MHLHRLLSLAALGLATACAAIPHPPPHGPVAPPAPVVLDTKGLLEAIQADYPQAKLSGDEAAGDLQITFGPGPAPKDIDTFVAAFLTRHSASLACGPTDASDAFTPEGKGQTHRVVYGSPLRDTGCRRVRLAFEVAPSGPVAMHRRCERFSKAPPSYAARVLPSTVTGEMDILVRVGSIGGIAGPRFSGFVIDRFGDVYTAGDPMGPTNVEPTAFLGDYVKTLPPSEVEQFAFDVSLVAREKEEPEPLPAAADLGGPVVTAYVGPDRRAIGLPNIAAGPARRATRWARGAVGR